MGRQHRSTDADRKNIPRHFVPKPKLFISKALTICGDDEVEEAHEPDFRGRAVRLHPKHSIPTPPLLVPALCVPHCAASKRLSAFCLLSQAPLSRAKDLVDWREGAAMAVSTKRNHPPVSECSCVSPAISLGVRRLGSRRGPRSPPPGRAAPLNHDGFMFFSPTNQNREKGGRAAQ